VAASPEISVVVPSHDRPLRLRWLLNALEEQTLAHHRFEVIVAHDSAGVETRQLLAEHPLARAGVLRSVAHEPGTAPPGRNRNAAWRVARAPSVLFTDDDCRPPRDWVERALDAARANPGAIVQGTTRPDPDERLIEGLAPFIATQSVTPPRPWAQACNILYPRSALELTGGFPEDMYVGEDTALAEVARARGVSYVAAPEMLTHHSIEELPLVEQIRRAWRWRGLPLLIKRHPHLRDEYPLCYFWERDHVWLLPALAGLAFLRRDRHSAALLAAPYLYRIWPRKYPPAMRAQARAAGELPGIALVHVAEMVSMVWGSLRHRTLFL